MIPILRELTNKKVYWAPEFRNSDIESDLEETYFYDLSSKSWTRQTMDIVWQTSKNTNSFLHLHAPYTPLMERYLSEKKAINIFIERDPRDQMVSLLNHHKYIQPSQSKFDALPNDEEKLNYLIKNNIRKSTLAYMGWRKSRLSVVLNFEKLMGVNGGKATEDEAIEQLRILATKLQINASTSKLKEIYQKHFGHGWSFFRGKVGTWNEYFNEEQKAAVKAEIGDLLIELGYENDLSW